MSERSAIRLFTLRVLVLSLLLALFGRLWYLQVLAGDQYSHAAATTLEHEIITSATRGEIVDDWGRAYAENTTQLVVSVNWSQLQSQRDRGNAVETRLATLLGEDPRALIASITPCTYSKDKAHRPSPLGCYTGLPYQPIPVTDNASSDQAFQILERQDDYPGVTATVQSIRKYLPQDGSVAANLIGYLGKVDQTGGKNGSYTAGALVGASGVEKQYEPFLRGIDGKKVVALDRQGNQTAEISDTPEVPGNNVVLSIDAGVQGLLENSLAAAVTRIAPSQKVVANSPDSGPTHPTQAAGIIMNAQTGEIVASASYPSYDPKKFEFPRTDKDNAYIAALNKDPAHPLLNQVTQGQYAPGSTFKLITTSAELDSGRADWSSLYDCEGQLEVSKGVFKKNSESESLGKINLNTTIAKSCDTVYYQFALDDYSTDYNRVVKQHLPALEGVTKMAKAFGLSAATGVDLPSEAKGLIQTWQETATLAQYYHDQQCIGAYGGKDANGNRVAPNKNKTKRALDKAACDHQLQSYDKILYPGNYADEYIGQGTVLATPVQMAVAYSAEVNGGRVFSPKVAKAIVTPEGKLVKAIKPQVQRVLPVSQSNLSQIKQAMYDVVTKGTAKDTFAGFPLDKVAVGGKTGTAQVENLKTGKPDDTSVFASFAGLPGQDPQYVSIIIVPKGGYGADVAGPATRLVWDGMYGLEGKPNVLPQGLRSQLPHFSLDGNIVTKAPGIVTPSPSTTDTPLPGSSASPGSSGKAGPSTTPATSGSTPSGTAGAGAAAKALPQVAPTPGAGPSRVVALGASGRAPPTT